MKLAADRPIMKLARRSFFCVVAICLGLGATPGRCEPPIRVAIYDHSDGSANGPKALKRVLGDTTRFVCKRVSPEDIRKGALDDANLLIMPGGSGSLQAKKLQPEGREKIKAFVKEGGAYLGICAGAYLATSHYEWSLHLINAKVVDREHWARGTGTVELSILLAGQKLFSDGKEKVAVYYGQGPLLAPDEKKELPAYEPLAEYAGEIAKNGAPKGVMIGTTAIARAEYGKGRVVCFSPHCEVKNGPNEMVVRAVLWATRREAAEVASEPAKTDAGEDSGASEEPAKK